MTNPRWRHQEEAFQLLRPLSGSALFMEMGTGKSRVALDLLREWNITLGLVTCPKAVVDVWPHECEKHHPSYWTVIPIDGRTPIKKLDQCKHGVFLARNGGHKVLLVINYESAWRDPVGKFLQTCGLQALVLDEMHRIKAPGGKASRYFMTVAKTIRRRLGLTGTPLPHSPLDIYAQYRTIAPNIFGYSFVGFRSRYAVMRPLGAGNTVVVQSFVNLEELHEKMYKIAFRVQSKDVLDLPPFMDEVRKFDLSPKARRIYDDLEEELVAEIGPGEIISTPNILTKLLRLQQIACGWITADYSEKAMNIDTGKADLIADIIEDIGKDEPFIVFCRFTKDIQSVRKVCDDQKITVAEISGQHKEIAAFHSGAARAIVCQITSGGLGIDLTRARYCFYYSTGHSLGDYMQSRARPHRPGQTRPVTYYHLIARNTVDEDIYAGLQRKGDLVTTVLDTMRQRRCQS